MSHSTNIRTRTRLLITTISPILAVLVLLVSDNLGKRYNDMTELKNLIIVPIVLGGFFLSLLIGICAALPPRWQPALTITGAVISLVVFGAFFLISRTV